MEKIEEYCKFNEYALKYTYVDKALTASTDNRPQFLKAVQDAKQGFFDVLLVYKFDRFARNLEDAIVYAKMLENYDVHLISVNEALPDGASGKLMYNIISSVNDFYIENLRQEVKEKTLAVAKKGYFIGGKCPYGFDLTEVKDEYGKIRKKYVINEEQAVHVRDMFRLYATGSSLKYIAEKMKRKTGDTWRRSTIRDMLDNYKYGGYFTYNRGTKGKRHQERDDMIKIPNAIPRIVDEETFDNVRQRFEGNKHISSFYDKKNNYMLRGIAVCGICGHQLHGDGGKHPQYVCPEGKRKNHESLTIAKKKAERFAIGYLKSVVFKLDKINFDEFAGQINAVYQKQNTIVDEKREKMLHRKAEIKKQKENIIEAIKQGYGSQDLKDEMNNLESEQKAIGEKISSLSQKNELYITGEDLRERFQLIRNRLLSEDETVLSQTLKAVIKSATVYPGGVIEIQLNESMPVA